MIRLKSARSAFILTLGLFLSQALGLQTPAAHAEFSITFSSGSGVSNAADDATNFQVTQAIAQKRIVPLIAMLKHIEKNFGGEVLDASLITPKLSQPKTWYYQIKHRAANGRVTMPAFWAHNGKLIQ